MFKLNDLVSHSSNGNKDFHKSITIWDIEKRMEPELKMFNKFLTQNTNSSYQQKCKELKDFLAKIKTQYSKIVILPLYSMSSCFMLQNRRASTSKDLWNALSFGNKVISKKLSFWSKFARLLAIIVLGQMKSNNFIIAKRHKRKILPFVKKCLLKRKISLIYSKLATIFTDCLFFSFKLSMKLFTYLS